MWPLLEAPPGLGGRPAVLAEALHRPRGQSRLRAAVWVLALVSLLGFVVEGANRPPDPRLTHHYLPGTAPARVPLTVPPTHPRP